MCSHIDMKLVMLTCKYSNEWLWIENDYIMHLDDVIMMGYFSTSINEKG